MAIDRCQSGFPLGPDCCRRRVSLNHKPVPVLDQRMTHEVEFCRLALALAVEFCFWISGARVRVVAAGFPVKLPLTVAARRRRFVTAILGSDALQARPCLNKRAGDREVIVRQEPLHLRMTQHSFQQLARNIGVQQTVAVLREGRVVPNRIVGAAAKGLSRSDSKAAYW